MAKRNQNGPTVRNAENDLEFVCNMIPLGYKDIYARHTSTLHTYQNYEMVGDFVVGKRSRMAPTEDLVGIYKPRGSSFHTKPRP